MSLYPLKFDPIFKYRMWGGEKLKSYLAKNYPQKSVGESWELSCVPNDESIVSNGIHKGKTLQSLLEDYGATILGKSVHETYKNNFPLLFKFIDAKKPLSIQVHPNDEIAEIRNNSLGKSEMWYVMQADDDAELIIGFNQSETKESYRKAIKDDKIVSLLNKVKVKSGDAFYIPAGRIHAIGAGVLLAEIQQTSDITYRIYDYNRVDSLTNKKRNLHTLETLDVIDFKVEDCYHTEYLKKENTPNKLIHTPFFKTDITILNSEVLKNYTNRDSFIVYMCVEGSLIITYNDTEYSLKIGEVILLPANINELRLNGKAKIIEIYL